jgi:molecular chaperone Hsp33
VNDAIIPFVFESIPVRGTIIQLQKSWQRLLANHDYEPGVREVLGQSAAATALIAQSLKFDSSITLQISGDGPLSMLVMQCTSDLEFRGMASAAENTAGLGFASLVANAHCAITVDSGALERSYQGIVEISEDSLAQSLENYFLRSVQIPSHLQLLADETVCGGILLQQMPGEKNPLKDDWRRLGLLAATLGTGDMQHGGGLDLLQKLFAEDDVRVFEQRPVIFRCRCTRQRAQEVLRLLGEKECQEALSDGSQVVVTCEYCSRRREFDGVDIAQLFVLAMAPPSKVIH